MTVPLKERYFDDYATGEIFEMGDYLITRAEILDFAGRYDPQAFHLDEAAARASIFGGLIASGWMTCSVLMRILVDHFISPVSSMGSPGIDEIRWLKPVRPGDRLKARVTVLDTRRSSSRPDRGIVHFHQEALNQDGEVVLSMRGMGMSKTRPT
jgi:acyl dehydratase